MTERNLEYLHRLVAGRAGKETCWLHGLLLTDQLERRQTLHVITSTR